MMRSLVPIIGLVLLLVLSGCIQKGGQAGAEASQGGSWSAESEYGVKPYPIQLHEQITPGTEKTWTFEWRNDAPADNPVEYNGACEGPFRVTLYGPDGAEKEPEEPQMHCQAIDVQTLDAGDSLTFAWKWDGKVWSDDAKKMPASGLYTVEIGFEGYHNGNREHITDDAVGRTTVYIG